MDKMKDHVIIIGDFLQNDRNKEKLGVLLNMFGLPAVTNVPTRIHKKTKSAINRIILNPELWSFKTEVFEISLSDHFGQILQLDHESLQGQNFKQNKATDKYSWVTNEENIKYLNYLLSGEDWENVYQQQNIDITYKEFLQTLTYYFDTAIPLTKVNINKQTNKKSMNHTWNL
jgi:hypothetical protein